MKQPRSGLIRSLRIASLIIRVAAGSAMLACATAGVRAETVTTPSGTFPSATYQGVAGNGITMFRGIRYASAPTGALRFAAPTPPAPIAGTIAATQFGSSCPQSPSAFGTASTDEDCLFLNVYVPGASVSSANSLPVMVFFHGGAFIYGEGSDYDPTAMAIEGHVVVVTINYRLGILGYLADAALSTQAPNRVSGNYGLMDQQFSLKWVQQNIGAFGGNARNVTIFGESAGGFSVCSSVVSPAAAGLFQRAITESGPCTEPLPTLAGAQAAGAAIVEGLGCNLATSAATVACLRGLSVPQILAAQNAISATATLSSIAEFFPNVDGVLIPQQPVVALLLGLFNQVPVIEGTNHDEGRLFVALAFDLAANGLGPGPGPLTPAEYPAAVQSVASTLVSEAAGLLGGATNSSTNQSEVQQITKEILQEYPLGNYASPDLALSAILTDSVFSCPANIANELFSLHVPTFGYEFNDENAPMAFLPPVSFPYGATHTDELQFLFTIAGRAPSLSPGEQTLATTMKGYWTTLARNGEPNSGDAPDWPPFNIISDDIQSLVPPQPSLEFNFVAEHRCIFWAGILGQTIFQSVASQLLGLGIRQ